jgi:hypothetical protein
MQPAPQMQQIITAIAQRHGIDVATVPVGSSLRLEMPHFSTGW